MKKIFLLFLLLTGALGIGYSQSGTCAGATLVTVDAPSCNLNQAINDITFETAANNTNLCGTGENVTREEWYQFQATATTASVGWSSSRAPGIEIFSGTCGSLVQIGCSNSQLGSAPALPAKQTEYVDLTGLTVGAFYLVRIVNTAGNNISNGTLCITSEPFAMDCSVAHPVCNDVSFSSNSPGYYGQELNATNRGCLSTNEHQTTWFGFSPILIGTLQFLITPIAGSVDYDFAVWGPYPTPTCPVTGTPIRCSYSANPVPTGCTFGETNVTDFSEPSTGSGTADGLVRPLTITAGDLNQIFYLVVDNYATNATPFTLDWTFSTPGMLDCTPPLPVQLGGFQGMAVDKYNQLIWSTESEINNDHFIIEKSSDAVNYTELGRVKGNGNSNIHMIYDLTDNEPYSTTYYQLKQVDYNGDYKYFGPITINNDRIAELSLQKIYPNPAENSFFIEISSKELINADLNVFDSFGRLVYSKPQQVDGPSQIEVQTTEWNSGVYTVKISNDEKGLNINKKVIIQ